MTPPPSLASSRIPLYNLAYFSVLLSKSMLAQSLPHLRALSSPAQVSRTLFFSALAIAAGKATLGPVIDRLSGPLATSILLPLLSLLFLLISSPSSSAPLILGSLVLVDFVFSAAWPSLVSSLQHSLPPQSYAPAVGQAALAGRLGCAASFPLGGALLRRTGDWRSLYTLAAAATLAPFVLLVSSSVRAGARPPSAVVPPPPAARPSLRHSFSALSAAARTGQFWLYFIPRSLLMVYSSFLLFLPLYLSTAHPSISPRAASLVCSLYSLGSIASLRLLSGSFSSLPPRARARRAAALLAVATIVPLVLASPLAGSLSAPIVGGLFFLYGFSFSLPFYVPPTLYVMNSPSPASLDNAFDLAGFLFLSGANAFAATVGGRGEWRAIFLALGAIGAVSCVSMTAALAREAN
jgi:MFS family permease